MTYFRQEECKDCEEGKVFKGYNTYMRKNFELVDEEKWGECIECNGTGIIEIEEEE
jgi:hypothetical protein